MTEQVTYPMTNAELARAIAEAHGLLERTSTSATHRFAIEQHLQTLLRVQLQRAEQILAPPMVSTTVINQ